MSVYGSVCGCECGGVSRDERVCGCERVWGGCERMCEEVCVDVNESGGVCKWVCGCECVWESAGVYGVGESVWV